MTTADRSTYRLDATERARITTIVREVWQAHDDLEAEAALRAIAVACHELPRGLRSFVTDFRLNFSAGYCVLKGWGLKAPVPATPNQLVTLPGLVDDAYLLLVGSLLGDPFAWRTQQQGRLVHDILPLRGQEQTQLGASSTVTLDWHTEDAFHELRPDFVVLMCLRNPLGTATTVAMVDPDRLTDEDLQALFRQEYVVEPDTSHVPASASEPDRAGDLRPVSLLYGDPRMPFLRADRAYMSCASDDPTSQLALRSLRDLLDASLVDIVLEPGDVCIINNHRAVHGRKPFTPRYDGSDRWLKRVCIARDLHRSYESAGSGARLRSAF